MANARQPEALQAVEPQSQWLEEAVRDHLAMVYSIAYHLLNDPAEAEDVAQEVFLALYRHPPKLASEEHLKHWLRKVACHRSLDRLRKRRLTAETAVEELPTVAEPPRLTDVLLENRLRRLVASLPPARRLLVILRYGEDMTPEEIARLLGVPAKTVRTQLLRTLDWLKDKIQRAWPGGLP